MPFQVLVCRRPKNMTHGWQLQYSGSAKPLKALLDELKERLTFVIGKHRELVPCRGCTGGNPAHKLASRGHRSSNLLRFDRNIEEARIDQHSVNDGAISKGERRQSPSVRRYELLEALCKRVIRRIVV